MTPEEFVRYVANDYVEMSHDKVLVQRNFFIKLAKQIEKQHLAPNDAVAKKINNFLD